MPRRCRVVLLLLLVWPVACSRPFHATEQQFEASVESLRDIRNLLVESGPFFLAGEAEERLLAHLERFEQLQRGGGRVSFQLAVRLHDRYHREVFVLWSEIDYHCQVLRRFERSPALLKLEAWLAKMKADA